MLGIENSVLALNSLEIEGGYVMPGYNDVAIPGDSGTKFSLTDDLETSETGAYRLRYSRTISDKHQVAVLVAPLKVKARGTIEKDVDFNGTTFEAGTPIDASFRFDSYRLIYRYEFYESDKLQFSFGCALKVRDAAIRLEGGGLESEKTNTGAVPLLSFNLTWTPVDKVHFLMDGEALAAPQGRAEDILFAAQYDVNRTLSLRAGYRLLEGGSDTEEVYTFSLFHYIVAGVVLSL